MGYGVGEYELVRPRVDAAYGPTWAARLDSVRELVEYGPRYERGVWDDLVRAFRALDKGEGDSAAYWWASVENQATAARTR